MLSYESQPRFFGPETESTLEHLQSSSFMSLIIGKYQKRKSSKLSLQKRCQKSSISSPTAFIHVLKYNNYHLPIFFILSCIRFRLTKSFELLGSSFILGESHYFDHFIVDIVGAARSLRDRIGTVSNRLTNSILKIENGKFR